MLNRASSFAHYCELSSLFIFCTLRRTEGEIPLRDPIIGNLRTWKREHDETKRTIWVNLSEKISEKLGDMNNFSCNFGTSET